MEIEYLSYSRVSTFLNCAKQLQFYLESKKDDKLYDVLVTDPGPKDLGSALHDTLEAFFTFGVDRRTEVNLVDCYKKSSKLYNLSWSDFEDGTEILKDWYKRSADQLPANIVALEQNFSVDIGDGVRVVGVWDRVEKSGGTYIITDYKSGRMPVEKYSVEKSLQLGMYNLAARMVYPDAKKVITVYDFLRWNRTSSEMDSKTLDNMRNYLKSIHRRIVETKVPRATVSSSCKWCEYRFKCKEFEDVVISSNISIPKAEPGEMDALLNELDALKRNIGAMSLRQEEIEDFLKEDMLMRGLTNLEHGDWEVRLTQSQRTYYDIRTVIDIFGRRNMLDEVVSVKKGEVDKLLKFITMTPEEEKHFIETCKFTKSRPSIRVEKKKGEFV
jgi:RecB family exonuclease